MNIFDDIKESITNIFNEMFVAYETSSIWLEYRLGPTISHCLICVLRNNKIYFVEDQLPNLPEHEKCKCSISGMRKIKVGNATRAGKNGADFWLKHFGKLPSYYITKENAYALGWKPYLGNLQDVAPGKMIGGDIFQNRANKLPNAPGRIWYECDIDYQGGFRNNYRLIYSNDGLVFKTDSHYNRFISVE